MTIWFVFGGLTAAVLLLLIRPLMRQAVPDLPRDSFDQAIYRDQLAEVARDLGRGVIAETDAKAVRLEVERRLLGAATRSVDVSAAKEAARLRPAPALATVLILIVPAMAIGLYSGLGAPDTPDSPFSGRAVERAIESDDGSLDLAKVKAALEARLAKDPNSLEGWVLLARNDGTAQDWAGARAAWTKALTLSHNDPDVLQDFGEMLVMQDQGVVGTQAKALFQQAASAEKTAFRARFYLGVAKIQAGDRKGGLADWHAIEKDSPPDSPWRGQITESIKQLDQPAPAAPESAPPGVDPAMAGMLMNMPQDQRMQAIQGMVAGLAARLHQNPNDLPGWKRLAHSYQVLGQPLQSADAFAQAAKLDPKDPSLLVGEADALGSAAPDGSPPSAAMLALFVQALALDPKQPDSLWMLGLAAHGSHQDNVAAGYWQRLLVTLDPASQDYADVKKALGSLGHS